MPYRDAQSASNASESTQASRVMDYSTRRLFRSGRLSWNEENNTKRSHETTFTTKKGTIEAVHSLKSDRSGISSSLTDLLSRPSQSSSKPFGCPNLDCNRTFTSITGLIYHTSQGYCISLADYAYPLQLSALSTKPEQSSGGVRGATSKHTGIFRKMFSKLLGKTKPLNRDRRRSPVKSEPFRVGNSEDTERGRTRYRTSRATSAPRIHRLNQSLSPQLTSFPPPPPHVSINQEIKVQTQQEHQRRQDKSHRQLQAEGRRKNDQNERTQAIERVDSVDEEERTGNMAFNILRSRPLPSRRLSERNPILSRPYSHFSNSSRQSSGSRSSRSSSIQVSSMGHNSRLRLNIYSLSPPASRYSIFPEISAEPHASSARLAKPLPLPPSVHLGRAARESEWENSPDSFDKYADRHIITSSRTIWPRTVSSRRIVPRFAHRSSRHPSKSYVSRSLGSFFSDLPSIIPSPPSSGSSFCSRTSSRGASANYAPGYSKISSTPLSTPPTSPLSMDGSTMDLHAPSSSILKTNKSS